MPAELQSPFESPHWGRNFHLRAEPGAGVPAITAKSSFLINSSNIRESPGPQREISGPRTWSLGCPGPGDAAQDMNHGSRTVTSCYENAVYFPCSFSPGPLSAVPATKAASCGGCKVDACQQELSCNHWFISQRLLKQPSAGSHARRAARNLQVKSFSWYWVLICCQWEYKAWEGSIQVW